MINAISKTEQLKNIIIKEIKNGVYKSGDALPSIQEYCEKYNLSKHTVSQTFSKLSELGLVSTSPGKISKVTFDSSVLNLHIIYAGTTAINRQVFWNDVYQGTLEILENNAVKLHEFSVGGGIPQEMNLSVSQGAILLGTVKEEIIRTLDKYSIPCVQIYNRSGYGSSINCDIAESMKKLICKFHEQGIRKLSYIDRFHVENGQSLDASKYSCIYSCLEELKMDCSYFHSVPSLKDAYNCMSGILKEKKTEAVILSTDILAPGIYRAVHDANLKIPEDIKIASFDNLEISEYMIPSLSTIDIRRKEAGRRAAEKLLHMISGGSSSDEFLHSELITRESLS